jgi:asparagine synthase (glutamine-hydrolysing)
VRRQLVGKYGFVKYFRPEFENFEKANQETDFALIRNALIKATQRRLKQMFIGVLLSGGLDSSLITAICEITSRKRKKLQSSHWFRC